MNHSATTDLPMTRASWSGRIASPFASAAKGGLSITLGATGLVLLAGAEEALSRGGIVNEQFLPPASRIGRRAVALLFNQPFLLDLRATMIAAGIGLLVATAIGVTAGIVLGLSRRTYAASRLFIDMVRPIPAVAFVPLLVLVVGLGAKTVVITVVLAAMWPVLLNTMYGIHGVDGVALQAARACGAGRLRRLLEVTLPSAAPAMTAGIRIALSMALVVTVATELIVGTQAGIGSYILRASEGGTRTDYVYAAVCIAGLLGLACNVAAVAVERRFLPWVERSDR